MAIYSNGAIHLNNMERSSGGMTKYIGHDMVSEPLVADDVVILGALPRESLTIDMRIIVQEIFDNGGFDVGFYNYGSGTFTTIATIAPPATNNFRTIVLDMPTDGVSGEDGLQYTGDRGSIWNGESETIIAMKWTGSTPTVGQAKLVSTHTYFGTKEGAYGGDYVPMNPSR